MPWRDVLRVLRRREARGEIRGGRFVAGAYGEQYALPEAVDGLRRVRREREEDPGEIVRVAAVDPLNLVGIATPGDLVPAQGSTGVLYRDGVPAGTDAGTARVARSAARSGTGGSRRSAADLRRLTRRAGMDDG